MRLRDEDSEMKLWIKLMEIGAMTGCHQMPERSFFFKGYQFPVCERCTGLLIGYILGFGIEFLCPFDMLTLFLICVPLIIDGTTQYAGLRESNPWLRLFTGIICGIGVAGIELKIIKIIGGWIVYEVSKLWK